MNDEIWNYLKEQSKLSLSVALLCAADEAYKNDVLDTEMEEMLVGKDLEFSDKDDWIMQKLQEWL